MMQMQSSACNSSSCRSFSLLLGLPQAPQQAPEPADLLNRVRVLKRRSSSNRFPSCLTCVSCGILAPIGGSLIRNIDGVGDMLVTSSSSSSSSSSTLLIRTEKERHHLFRFKQYHRRRTDDRRLLVSAGGSSSSSGVSSVKGEEEFQAEVLEEKEVAVLVEFVADWCGPCRLMSSIIDWASQEYKGRMKVVKIDHDLNPKLIEEYKVFGLPALILFHDGKEVPESRWEGAMTKAKLKEYLERLLDLVNAT